MNIMISDGNESLTSSSDSLCGTVKQFVTSTVPLSLVPESAQVHKHSNESYETIIIDHNAGTFAKTQKICQL